MRKRSYIHSLPLFVAAGMAVLNSAAMAQQPGPASPAAGAEQPVQYSPSGQAASQSGPSPAGGIPLKLMDTLITVYPTVRLDMQHNDNIYSAPTKVGDRILVLTPALRLETKQGGNTYSLRMSSAMGRYQTYTSENYTYNNVNGLADLNLGTRLRASLRADYLDGSDPRGSTNNPVSTTPDLFRQTYGQGIISYGAPGAQGRIDFELGQRRRSYLNNRATTAANDLTAGDLGATFYWRVGPKTSLIFQGRHSKIDYSLPASTLGSVENLFLVGATWEATAKTTGTFRVGMVKKNFEDPTRSNSSQVGWTGEVRWSPLTYSNVILSLNRAPAETTGGVGDFIDRTATSARWTHDWSSRLTSDALASYMTDAYQGAARTDNTQKYGLRATYKMRRWLSFGADYMYTQRTSDDTNFGYKSNVIMLFVSAGL